MPYTTGSAADMAAVKTALVNACTSDGWTEQTDGDSKTVLSKSGIYVRVEAASYSDSYFSSNTQVVFEVLGRTGLDSGDAPGRVTMGDYRNDYGDNYPISFPVTYFIFTFISEVFLVINYGDRYQFVAFGQSSQSGLTGSGNWVAGTFGDNPAVRYLPTISSSHGSGSFSNSSMAFCWDTTNNMTSSYWLHNNIDLSYPWSLANGSNTGGLVGIKYLTELIDTQPNSFNSESVLLPIRVYKARTDNKFSQVCEVKNARHIRIDNYNPEEVLTLGSDQWMVFPYHRKDIENRDGGEGGGDHTGTFGWAIKKEN